MCKCVRSLLFIFILSAITSSLALAQSENNPPPLRRVTLYKHGVGYFERQGKVNDDQQVTFLFDAAQMNDVLKSLVALDQIRGIKLLDAKLREDLEQYLSILQSTIHKNLRKLTISTAGQGERDLFISYVVEAPIWKVWSKA